ncbi:MAG: leucine-rich repeat domain-containing protein, partial [Treponemataceae bacterium]|nr:leucine-rich repeat domain-containing protein [Treponemataceae bacterium]
MRYTFSGVGVGKIIFGGTVAEWADMADQDGFGESLRTTPVICSDGEWRWTVPAVPDVPVKPSEWQIEGVVLVKYTGSAADVTIPDGVTSIGENAFDGCDSLTNINIPASVTDIGAGAIPAGTTVTYHGTAERWDELAENARLDGITVFIIGENGTLTGYRGSAGDIILPDGVTEIAPGAFAGSGITEISYGGTTADWGALVDASGIADELDGITVNCADGIWTSTHVHTHTWGEYTDGGEDGHYRTCTECGERSETDEHTYDGYTDDKNGKHYQVCSVCHGQSKAVAHTYGDYTDDENGNHYQTCTAAGCNAKSEAVPHDCKYKDNGDDTHTTTCTKCDYAKPAEEHRYENGTCLDCKCPQPTTVYVASTGSDDNSGSRTKPFATIQKAVDTVIERNAASEGTSEYTIYVDGTLTQSAAANANGMADFSKLAKNLTLTIKAFSGTATLDANTLSRVIYA